MTNGIYKFALGIAGTLIILLITALSFFVKDYHDDYKKMRGDFESAVAMQKDLLTVKNTLPTIEKRMDNTERAIKVMSYELSNKVIKKIVQDAIGVHVSLLEKKLGEAKELSLDERAQTKREIAELKNSLGVPFVDTNGSNISLDQTSFPRKLTYRMTGETPGASGIALDSVAWGNLLREFRLIEPTEGTGWRIDLGLATPGSLSSYSFFPKYNGYQLLTGKIHKIGPDGKLTDKEVLIYSMDINNKDKKSIE